MSTTLIHLAIADKIYCELGDPIIKDFPLFFGGNIAPDAVHAKKDYKREYKKHSHLCDGIYSYGYGYPEVNKLFQERIANFIDKYYLKAGADKDLYLGYIVHLLVDEIEMFSACERLQEKLKSDGTNTIQPGFHKTLADEINKGSHKEFFKEDAYIYKILAYEYKFNHNAVDVLESISNYEVKDFVNADEINISKRWVINNVFKNKPLPETIITDDTDREMAVNFIHLTAKKVIEKIQCIL